MRFMFADSLDFVDPYYDFEADQHQPGRDAYWDDQYPHELMGYAPYDGILVSRAIVGDPGGARKYTESQAMRFRRVGARKFLRFEGPKYQDKWLFGDCGAFSYHTRAEPPYTPDDMVEFYRDGGFTHGCSIDHIIFEFDISLGGMVGGSDEARRRYRLTLNLAREFLEKSRHLGGGFTPVGVVQGWSPGSMAEAARELVAMGYRYLALGGMVPLKTPQIQAAVRAVREAIGWTSEVKVHILGFAKADELESYAGLGIDSFDTTSPLLRAFKDRKCNYYMRGKNGKLEYYTAIRVPQAVENATLTRKAKRGLYRQEDLLRWERKALAALRAYNRDSASLDETLEVVLRYSRPLISSEDSRADRDERQLAELKASYRHTLEARPWKNCPCPVCRAISIEVIIFRGSNRNKRRGMHNLGVFHQHLQDIRG